MSAQDGVLGDADGLAEVVRSEVRLGEGDRVERGVAGDVGAPVATGTQAPSRVR